MYFQIVCPKIVYLGGPCGSMFNILDGMPLSGPAETPLRMYQTFMPDEFTLRVFN